MREGVGSDGAVERTGLTAQVYERLLERIVDRQFMPRQRMNVDQLARELRVSITPVREALARLSSQRLIEFELYKGYSVLPAMDASRIDQLFDVRILIEVSAVRPGIVRADEQQISALQQSIATMRSLTPGDQYKEFRVFNNEDRTFHHLLVELAGNGFLIDMYETLSPHIHIGRFYHQHGVLDMQRIIDEHGAIVAAYERRDADEAEDRVRRHLTSAKERLKEMLPAEG